MASEKMESSAKLISLVLVAVGILVGAWQYWDSNRQGYKKEIWSAQKVLYEQAIEAASRISNGDDLASVSEHRKSFWVLYYGKLSMLESPGVAEAMVAFGKILRDCERKKSNSCFKPVPNDSRKNPLQNAALDIAYCARASLMKTWQPVDIGKLSGSCSYPK